MVSCSSSYGNDKCAGGWYSNAWDYANVYKIETESNYTYTANNSACDYTPADGVIKVSSQNYPQSNSVPAMKRAIATGPISVAVDATSTLF